MFTKDKEEMEDLDSLKSKAQSLKKENKKAFQQLKSKKDQVVDQLFHQLHDEVFEKIDCLNCANCCKTTGPLITDKDLERISKHLRLKPQAFIKKYLRIDEDKDYVLQTLPCPFLDDENYCSIYSVRPKACKEFPHTDRVKQKQLFPITLKNIEVCPAVFEMVEEIKKGIR